MPNRKAKYMPEQKNQKQVSKRSNLYEKDGRSGHAEIDGGGIFCLIGWPIRPALTRAQKMLRAMESMHKKEVTPNF